MSDFSEHELQLGGTGIELRTAGPNDHDLARRIVALATHWRATEVPYELPDEIEKYHAGWGRPGDIGVFAFQGIEFAGGACVRAFGKADGSYGYVDDRYPELSIGVEVGFRRRGIAVLLLASLKAKCLEDDYRGVSLSVEPDNPARDLYSKMGFAVVEERATDVLMLWRV